MKVEERKINRFIDRAFIETLACKTYTYYFLDSTFTIYTNQPSALVYFQKMYSDFQVQSLAEENKLGIYYVIHEPRLLEKPFIRADERIYPCPKPHMLPGYAHSVIVNSIMGKIQSHFLFHAAAVSLQGKGIIILGASSQGKSTLTLELINRGFKFFTDEITCIHRKDHLIYPFPRTVGLRKGSLQLFKEFSQMNLYSLPMVSGERKMVMQISEIPEIRISDPCLPRYLISLSTQQEKADQGGDGTRLKHLPGGKRRPLYMAVDRFEDKMMKDLRDIPGVKEVERIEGELFPVIKLEGMAGSFLLPRIEAICYQHQMALFDIAQEEKKGIDYSQKPQLSEIPKSIAMIELLRSFRGGWKSSILRETNWGIASMAFEIGHILEQVACYRMTLGRLGEMADLVEDLVMARYKK